ncbi:MAG: tetratricopeptide repeat protein [Magnetococcales bacterium]|nr:tetratricopeptide repeat protein [Magnetococcales bacterium]
MSCPTNHNDGQQQVSIDDAYRQAKDHFDAGQYTKTDQLCTAILNVAPNHIYALDLLGLVAQRINRHDLAVTLFQKAIDIDSCKAFLYYNLGTSLYLLGQVEETVQVYKKAIEFRPDFAEAYNGLGNSLLDKGELKEAVLYLQKALAITPNFSDAVYNLGIAMLRQGKLDDAITNFKKAIAINPDHVNAYINLGSMQQEQGKLDESIITYQKALSVDPNHVEAHYNLGLALQKQGKPEEAIARYHLLLSINHDYGQAHNNLGVIWQKQGELHKAVASFKKALSINSNYVEAHNNLIFSLDLLPNAASLLSFEERSIWAKRHAEPLKKHWLPPINIPDHNRKIRIGYVGADFRYHSAALIFACMLMAYDKNNFQVFCYSGSEFEDDLTEQLKQNTDGWLSTCKIDDAALAEKIRKDKIDILVDLAGHTPGNRLLTFARKPAPIQVTAWGYPLGTKMDAIDYIISDTISIPQSKRDNYSEKFIDISSMISLFSTANYPEVVDPPACKNGYITFGAFNRLEKNNDQVYTLWAKILCRIPTAKLLIKAILLDSQQRIDEIKRVFQNNGVSNNRLFFIGKTSHKDHIKALEQIDIMLDTFPANGGLTTLESLKMGVPVLTCKKLSTWPISASNLHILDLDEWSADSTDELVDKAVQFANNIDNLKTLRQQLRDRFDKSVLGNSELYVAEVEDNYRKIWQQWCNKQVNAIP